MQSKGSAGDSPEPTAGQHRVPQGEETGDVPSRSRQTSAPRPREAQPTQKEGLPTASAAHTWGDVPGRRSPLRPPQRDAPSSETTAARPEGVGVHAEETAEAEWAARRGSAAPAGNGARCAARGAGSFPAGGVLGRGDSGTRGAALTVPAILLPPLSRSHRGRRPSAERLRDAAESGAGTVCKVRTARTLRRGGGAERPSRSARPPGRRRRAGAAAAAARVLAALRRWEGGRSAVPARASRGRRGPPPGGGGGGRTFLVPGAPLRTVPARRGGLRRPRGRDGRAAAAASSTEPRSLSAPRPPLRHLLAHHHCSPRGAPHHAAVAAAPHRRRAPVPERRRGAPHRTQPPAAATAPPPAATPPGPALPRLPVDPPGSGAGAGAGADAVPPACRVRCGAPQRQQHPRERSEPISARWQSLPRAPRGKSLTTAQRDIRCCCGTNYSRTITANMGRKWL